MVNEFLGVRNPPHFIVSDERRETCFAVWDFRGGDTERPLTLPPEWRVIAGVIVGQLVFGNSSHPAGRRVHAIGRIREDREDLHALAKHQDAARLLNWFILSAYYRNGDDWIAVCETEPGFASEAWTAMSVGADELVFWDVGDRELIRFTAASAQVIGFDSPAFDQMFPVPGVEWEIEPIHRVD